MAKDKEISINLDDNKAIGSGIVGKKLKKLLMKTWRKGGGWTNIWRSEIKTWRL